MRARASRPASTTGCSMSNCVLTRRWSPTGHARVQRISRAEIDEMARRTRTFAPKREFGRRGSSGVGEHGGPALLEGLDALAEVVRLEQRRLARVSRAPAPPSSSVSVAALMACLVLRSATAGPRTSVATTLSTSASSSPAGCTAVTRPACSASAAGIRSASSAIRIARIRPTAAATRRRRPAVGHQPDLGEREHEIRLLRSEYDVARQCQRRADACGRALHDRDHRPWAAPTIDRTARLAASSTSSRPAGRRWPGRPR